MDGHGERKGGERLIRIEVRQDLLKGVPTAREEDFRVRWVEEDADREWRGDAVARIAQLHSRLEAGPRSPRPGYLGTFGILYGDGADDPGFLKRFAALFTGLVMRFHRAGHVCRAAGHEYYDLALHVLTCQIVVVQFGDGETVADKDGAGFDIFRGMRTDPEHRIFPEFQGLRFALAKQIERAARFVNLDHL